MLNLRLIFANIFRWRTMVFITLSTIAIAFFFFVFLISLNRVFNEGVNIEKAERLLVANRISLMQSLPLSYEARIKTIEGVELISRNVFFGAFYQDPSQGLMAIATEPKSFLQLMPEVQFNSSEQLQHWLDDPSSIVVGQALANKFNWKVGDLVPLFSYLYRRNNGGRNWTFRVAGIYHGQTESANTNSMFLHYSYLDNQRTFGQHTVGWYNIKISNSRLGTQIANQIDQMFANSFYETKTAPSEMFAQELIKQVGDFGFIVQISMTAVFFTLILVAANTMLHSVSERISEIATLKALGASDQYNFNSILIEGILMIGLGSVFGIFLAYLCIPIIASKSIVLANIQFQWFDLIWCFAAVIMLGVIVSLLPAIKAWRVDTAVDLGRTA